MRTDSHSLSQGARNAIHSRVEKCPSLVSTEAGLLRRPPLTWGLGLCPKLSPLFKAGRRPTRMMKSGSQQESSCYQRIFHGTLHRMNEIHKNEVKHVSA